ncbi:MAG: bifunctional (p)ppGpp synthetase/guanosine-3',5'-bis(diphosphate) 3'-pyrophosphohydrolase [Acidiferrobacterales bacterium]
MKTYSVKSAPPAAKPRKPKGPASKSKRQSQKNPKKAAKKNNSRERPEWESGRLLIGDLCELLETYLPDTEVADIYRAYLFGAAAHEGQTRKSGEPYIYHPIEVANILAGMHLDSRSIIAAILHDTIEDTETAKAQIASEFGENVAELVDGVSKISQIEFQDKEEEQAENFRKMMLAMSRDIRVIIIKMADRLHNMRTIDALPLHKRRVIARETLDIYAPIANRLGVRQWATELEDLSFSVLHPMRYRVLAKAMGKRHGNRKAIVERINEAIVKQLKQEGVDGEVSGREKNVYSVYRKMWEKGVSFENVHDLYGFRIIVDRVDTCYRVLGIIHNLYKPIPGRFKDYIAIPKTNGYQSLHTVVFGPYSVSIEVQIRARDMHHVAEVGVAAHWLYKSGEDSSDRAHETALQWLKNLLEIQQKAGNPREFLEHLKVDLFPDEVYVFTPGGEIKKLPRGATAIDFAYDVHTDVGNHAVGARVNHRLVPLRSELRNGDHVEILTSDWSRPNPTWLDHVLTGKARANIRSFLKNQQHHEAVAFGERLLDRALQSSGADMESLSEQQKQALLDVLKLGSWDSLLSEIGLGNRQAPIVARQLLPEGGDDPQESKDGAPAVAITGTEGVVVNFARCCRPIPGDPVLGFLTAGRGIVVHIQDCPNVAEYRKQPERWIDINWDPNPEGVYPVNLRIESTNQRGVLANVAATISQHEANIDTVSFDDRDGSFTVMHFTIEVRNRTHLAQIIRSIRRKEAIVRVNRTKG